MPNTLLNLLHQHRFFQGMPLAYLQALLPCAGLRSFKPNTLLGAEGDTSQYFFALLAGRVAIETHQAGKEAMVIQTILAGEVVGWSWMFPPYQWVFDARALEPVEAVAFDVVCLRECCEKNPALGYEVMKRMAKVVSLRLKAARLHLLDLYGQARQERPHG